ncbi:MAG: ATPase [Gemmatimonadetes bacterium]|nr:ATPase [Gemmatimonadota bacterium]MBT7859934.1 ATPase [Gemmatimonadota bacterium]
MGNHHLVGIDAGGTRTRALAAHQDCVYSRSEAGAGNYQILGLAGVVELFSGLVAQLEVDSRRTTLCAALAGAGRLEEQERLTAALLERGVASRICIVADARAALEGAHGGDAGIIAIAGTGSIVMGRGKASQVERAGGWGPLLGDEGSAYSLVMAGLRAAGRAHDGSGPVTRLEADLLKYLGLADWDRLIPALYGGSLERDRLAGACPVVFQAAREGDEVARQIISFGARRLGEQIRAVARRLDLHPAAVTLAGGLGEAEGDWLWAEMQANGVAHSGEPELRRVPAHLPPVGGALLLAFAHAGLEAPPVSWADCESG